MRAAARGGGGRRKGGGGGGIRARETVWLQSAGTQTLRERGGDTERREGEIPARFLSTFV